MSDTLTLKYKCRACVVVFGGLTSSAGNIDRYLWQLCCDGRITDPLPADGFAPRIRMFDSHHCKDGNTGIADLVGGLTE